MVHPHDHDHEEAEQEGEVGRPEAGKSGPEVFLPSGVGDLDLEDQEGNGDRDDGVAEGFDSGGGFFHDKT
jgi:hypothetical protein